MNEDKIVIITEDGKEIEYNILLSFRIDDYDKDYVAYFGEEEEIFVSSYVADGDGGNLFDIEDDKEWDRIEEVIETFLLEEDIEEA
ncbi:MAG: DUF1292 domain-containing protein [Bacilli bacterium]